MPSTIDRFAGDWSLPLDEMRLWVLAQELIGHAAVLDHIAARRLSPSLVRRHVGAFRPDPSAVAEKLARRSTSTTGDPMAALQKALSDPEVLLGAVRSPEQVALRRSSTRPLRRSSATSTTCVDAVAARVIGGEALRIAEAVRRRRVEATADDVFIERLLGLQLTHEQVQRGKTFVAGVVDRVGEAGLSRLFALAGCAADAGRARRAGAVDRPARARRLSSAALVAGPRRRERRTGREVRRAVASVWALLDVGAGAAAVNVRHLRPPPPGRRAAPVDAAATSLRSVWRARAVSVGGTGWPARAAFELTT